MTVTFDADTTTTPRRRLLESGKALFARNGFEQTPTSLIAREAGTSESQLVRYYRGKAGLLDAIFNELWAPLNQHIQQVVAGARDAHEALLGVLEALLDAFARDRDLAYLFCFEGRRIRGDSEVTFSQGFRDFDKLLHVLIGRGKRDGTFREDLSEEAIASALMGAAEGMVRDRLLAEKFGGTGLSVDEVRSVFAALVSGLGTRHAK